jgi:hypothetical protein
MKKNTIVRIILCVGIFLFLILAGLIINNYEIIDHNFNETIFSFEDHKRIVVAFRNDDLSVESDLKHEESLISIFNKYNIKQTFGFIPKTKNTEKQLKLPEIQRAPIVQAIKRWEREDRIALALHGYTHLKGPKTAGEFGGLSFDEQKSRISKGRRIAQELFDLDVEIFIPPYNQADINTYKACVDSGISVFSGFWGEKVYSGLDLVNGNASLFKSDYYNSENSSLWSIPDAETLLTFSQNTKGTAFIIIFYHSRADFNSNKNYSKLDIFLNKLSRNPLVEISTINQIHDKYSKALVAYNMANTHIYSAIRTISYAKPYLMVARLMKLNIKKLDLIATNLDNALKEYWSGNYKIATIFASETIKESNRYIYIGRFIFLFFCTVGSFLVYKITKISKQNKYKRSIQILRYSIFALPFIFTIFIIFFSSLSTVRISQYIGLLLIYYFGAITALLLSKMQEKNFQNNLD